MLLLHHVQNLHKMYMSSLNNMETVALSCLGHFDGGIPPGLLSLHSLWLSYDDTEVCVLDLSVARTSRLRNALPI